VVSEAGTLFEQVEAYTITIQQAREALEDAKEDGKAAEILRVAPGGRLTAEGLPC
jgi:hypothetical protein